MNRFHDRQHAGQLLASQLQNYKNKKDGLVLALPRGGVPVAYEIAKSLVLPLSIYLVRKLGVPHQSELAFGAISMDGQIVFNEEIVKSLNLSKTSMEQVIETEKKELNRRKTSYFSNILPFVLKDKIIILVDDGIATGATLRAAISAIQLQNPKKIIVAVPVGAKSSCQEIETQVDEFISILKPEHLNSVGEWYENFSQTSDEEVSFLLKKIRNKE
ncbi:MAG: hypothetical protein ACD_44C00270G0002 [uncultured bacterium]|nr:MAG: hypothetical protein ACD_44C00270G0002 [uncultured bacterium]